MQKNQECFAYKKISYTEFSSICKAVIKSDTKLKNNFDASKSAWFFDCEFISFLCDYQFQIIMSCKLPFHHINTCKGKEVGGDKVKMPWKVLLFQVLL